MHEVDFGLAAPGVTPVRVYVVQSKAGGDAGEESKYHIPGYTGFIPNSSEIAGRSYGRMTKRALNKPVRELLVGDQIPASPQATHDIHSVPMDTVVGLAEAAPRHVPGYTGFVPDTRERYVARLAPDVVGPWC